MGTEWVRKLKGKSPGYINYWEQMGATPAEIADLKAGKRGAKERATASAEVRQAEFEASKREGIERLALKRKKSFASSMIVNPILGSSATLGS